MRITSRASAFSGQQTVSRSPTSFQNKRARTREREAKKVKKCGTIFGCTGEMRAGRRARQRRGRRGARKRERERERQRCWDIEVQGLGGAEGAVDIRYIIKRSQLLMTDRQEEVLCCPAVEGNEFQEAVWVPSPQLSHMITGAHSDVQGGGGARPLATGFSKKHV